MHTMLDHLFKAFIFYLAYSFISPAIAADEIEKPLPERYQNLFDIIDTQGSVRVIVVLNASQQPALAQTSSTVTPTANQIRTRQFAVSELQNNFLNAYGGLAQGTYKLFKNYASIAFKVTSHDDLEQLKRTLGIVDIQEDRIVTPILQQSIPLIQADILAAQGYTGIGQAVAILDTGVEVNHDFLGGRVIAEACFSTNDGENIVSLCPNGNGAYMGAAVPCTSNVCYHGTHVAGIAAGHSMSTNLDGVARGAPIIAVQVFSNINSSIGAYTSDIILGMEYVQALQNDPDFPYDIAAINLSLGGGFYASALSCDNDSITSKETIDNLRSIGIATVIASGNAGHSAGMAWPGCISSAVSVGASTNADGVASFSNSTTWLSLMAPGQSIQSSVLNNGFGSASGTSMAAPHVAGAFSVLKSRFPSAGVDELLAALSLTGMPVVHPTTNQRFSRIDLLLAAEKIAPLYPSKRVINLILDNDYEGVIHSGSFSRQLDSGYFMGSALRSTASGVDSFRFSPNLSQADQYTVQAWWKEDANLSSQAQIAIQHSQGEAVITINQQINGGQWNDLGSYFFDATGHALVEISNANGGEVSVDAIRFYTGGFFISTESLPNATIGEAYSETIDFMGGNGPFSWSVLQSSLPSGLALDDASGVISGVPTAAGDYDFTVQVQDTVGAVASQYFTVTVIEETGSSDELNFNDFTLASYGGSQDKVNNGTVTIEDNGASLHLTGNRWQQIDLGYTITADTMIEFDYQSSIEGEIQGIGFDKDLGISKHRTFKLLGTQNWGILNYESYSVGSGVQHYVIPVGQFYTGFSNYLFFTNDHDVPNATAESIFSHVRVYESTDEPQVPVIYSTPFVNTIVGAPYHYDSNDKVEAMGGVPISFSLGYGPAGFSISTDGQVSWVPAVNQLGDHTIEIVATNSVGSTSQNFTLTVIEETAQGNELNFNDFTLASYGGSQDVANKGTVTIENNGNSLHLTGNRWQQIELGYMVTADTIIEFDYQSSAEGEIQGIGFDKDLGISKHRTFKLLGTQNWGILNYHNYNVGSGIQHYVIPVGQFYRGFSNYLFFANDHDTPNATGESIFSHIRVYESTQ